jgi:hypothetical protein
MTELATRADIADHVQLHERGATIDAHLPFNEWRDLVRQVLATTDRSLWTLGDLWLYGHEHYGRDYHSGLRELEGESRLMQVGARVARAYALPRRRQLAFELHAVVAAEAPDEQERWLDEAERQGWNREQLSFAFVESMERVPVAAISVRAVGEVYELCIRAADKRDMDPKEWMMRALERAAREELAGEVAA